LSIRVPKKREAFRAGDPRFVIYRSDPATQRFIEISGSPERLLGFPAEEWVRPRFWSGRIHPEDHATVHAFLEEWSQARRDEQLAYRVVDAAGETVWVQHFIAVRRAPRQETSVRGVLLDITDLVAREGEVEKALFLKDELFRFVVEELGPPLRAMSVYSEMLERHLAAQRDDVGSDFALGLRDGLERLDAMLGHLMRVAQRGGSSIDEMNAGLASLRGSPAG
jgi:PAS domain S-box-containing protein